MNRKGFRWKGLLFLFAFVFTAALTMTTNVPAEDVPCCEYQCLETFVWFQGNLVYHPGRPSYWVCEPVSITHPCWNGDCMAP